MGRIFHCCGIPRNYDLSSVFINLLPIAFELLYCFKVAFVRHLPMAVRIRVQYTVIMSLFFFIVINSYDDQFVVASFDGEPTADSEMFNKMHQSVREVHESKVGDSPLYMINN